MIPIEWFWVSEETISLQREKPATQTYSDYAWPFKDTPNEIHTAHFLDITTEKQLDVENQLTTHIRHKDCNAPTASCSRISSLVWLSVGSRSTAFQNQYRNWLQCLIQPRLIFFRYIYISIKVNFDFVLTGPKLDLNWPLSKLGQYRENINRGRTMTRSQLRYLYRTAFDRGPTLVRHVAGYKKNLIWKPCLHKPTTILIFFQEKWFS